MFGSKGNRAFLDSNDVFYSPIARKSPGIPTSLKYSEDPVQAKVTSSQAVDGLPRTCSGKAEFEIAQ